MDGLPLLHDVGGFGWKTQELGVIDNWEIESPEVSVTHMLGG